MAVRLVGKSYTEGLMVTARALPIVIAQRARNNERCE